MTRNAATVPSWEPKPVKVAELSLDPKNPRLRDFGLDEKATEIEILSALWKQMAVDELVLSIAENGFYGHEPLLAAQENGKLYVIEGNRRLAAVKLLLSPQLRADIQAREIPALSEDAKSKLKTLPVVICERSDPQVWAFLGFKHINGPHAWDSFPKAAYIAWLHNSLKQPLEEIARRIGDKHNTVVRHYDAYMVLEQAEAEDLFSRDDRFKNHFSFSHLFTGLGLRGIRSYLGLPLDKREIAKQRPVSKNHLPQLKEVMLWLYGSKRDNIRPVVQTQNPDLRNLDDVLESKNGVIALRRGLPLKVSLDVSKGDQRIFRESLVEAKQDLQKARGTVLTGYDGSADLLELAVEISKLATSIVEDMHKEASSKPTSGRRGGASSKR